MIRKTNNSALFPELRGTEASIRYPAFVEPKRDGEYCVAMAKDDPKSSFLINKYGTQRYDCQITYQLATFLKQAGIKQMVLLGELCYMHGHNGDLYKLLSHKTNENFLKYYIFDIVSLDGKSLKGEQYLDRREILLEALMNLHSTSVMVNPVAMAHDESEMQNMFSGLTKQGFEGVVIKNMDSQLVFGPCGWVKKKCKDQTVYEIQAIDPVKERIEIRVDFTNEAGQVMNRAVGCKCTNKQKKGLKVGDKVLIEHQGLLSAGGLRHPVFIKKGVV